MRICCPFTYDALLDAHTCERANSCRRCYGGPAVITVVLPGRDGRIGSPGTYEMRICRDCDSEMFGRRS